ncbi:MAG: hypothetical protein MUO63_16575, partial [Desulfobulbaceae bacterium]|nr:hypothetical protein [Desulfobulbaceae bacterium]
IVVFGNVLYKTNTNHTSASEFSTDSAKWVEYKDTRWYPSHAYPANTAVYDKITDAWYWTQSGGTSLAAATDITGDTSITWVPYDGTSIEIFNIVEDGYDVSSCEEAINIIGTLTGTGSDSGSLGQLKSATEDCMGFSSGGGNTVEQARKTSFNHAMQECWYYNKFGHFQPGGGTVSSMKSACANVYDYMNPGDITNWDSSYVCAGSYQPENDKSPFGYVGRCWEPSAAAGVLNCVPHDCGTHALNTKWEEGSGSNKVFFGCRDHVVNVDGSAGADGTGELYECTQANLNQCDLPIDSEWNLMQSCEGGGDLAVTGWTNDNFYYINPCPYKTCLENDDLLATCTSALENFSCVDDGTTWTCYEALSDGNNLTDNCYTADATGDLCVDQAIKDFCSIISVPEVIDPSDSTSLTGEVWNAPAYLVDSGLVGQMDQPIATMRGYVYQPTTPTGVLHSTAAELRIGAMAFNSVGSLTECASADPSAALVKYCPAANNKDGASVISEIRLGSENTGSQTHVEDLADAINDVRATSWTPLAEAMYTAIGYYTQNDNMKLDAADFTVGNDPVTNSCQENHILIITEGASTADVNQEVMDYVNGFPINDNSLDSGVLDQACTDGLQGSTYLDDLTYIAQNAPAADLYPAGNSQLLSDDGTWQDKPNLTTHIVATGTLRDVDNTECSPDEIIKNAASNGGTVLLESASPAQLEQNLLEVFNELRQRASAGSAASVISSARGGEGAIYQAIFWPELKRQDDFSNDWSVDWVGDIHGLFLNEYGYMYEDTNLDRTLNPTEDVDNDGKLDVDEDANGNGYLDAGEDIDGDGNLDVDEDLDNDAVIDGEDKRVILYFDAGANRSRGCYNTSIFFSGTCMPSAAQAELHEIKYLWSANEWLSRISNLDYWPLGYNLNDIYHNRQNFISAELRRHIFTWVDLDNDGAVDTATEVKDFVDRNTVGTEINWAGFGVSNRGSVELDFNAADNDEVRRIIRWVRGADWTEDINANGVLDAGEDVDLDGKLDVCEDDFDKDGEIDAFEDSDSDGTYDSPQRCRKIPVSDSSATKITWRLGDIIHSTPMTVTSPAEGYHLLYNDLSFAKFLSRWKERRHMIYLGANDGMLHAVNGGFFGEKEKKFCLVPLNNDGICSDAAAVAPALGTEMWAYVPYNLLPHLKCMTEKDYSGSQHKYYVDLRPRIFDVKIFNEEAACAADHTATGCIHPEGWGTILVGGMRFGGTPVDAAKDLGQPVTDNRQFISSYFILDITNPEQPPVLLGELTQTLSDSDADLVPDSPEWVDLGFSTVIPTMVIMKDVGVDLVQNTADDINKWYLVFGSGPHGPDAMKGVSDQNAKLSVLALNDLVDGSNQPVKALRIPSTLPISGTPDGTIDIADSPNGFVSDPITVDFDINPSVENYKADAVYFGTVEGDFATDGTGKTYWDGGGTMNRLVTRKIAASGHWEYGLGASEPVTKPHEWVLKPLIDLSNEVLDGFGNPIHPAQPITASPSVGTDGKNFWIYFGTGRFFDADDKTDDTQQSYYGIKEPMGFVDPDPAACTNSLRTFTWDKVELVASGGAPGEMGLFQVDEIEIAESSSIYASAMTCTDDPIITDCLPSALVAAGTTTFNYLIDYFAGAKSCLAANYYGSADGWYRNFSPDNNRERNLGQATLLGGLLTFTTYQPYNDACLAEGLSYLYGLYYQTGTAWHERIYGDYGVDILGNVEAKMELGRGLALTPNLHVGSGDGDDGSGPRVFLQTSTGEIKEIKQENVPHSVTSGRFKWKEWTGSCP